jgi:hypothetical protein
MGVCCCFGAYINEISGDLLIFNVLFNGLFFDDNVIGDKFRLRRTTIG